MCYINIINAGREIISPNIYHILNKGTLYTFEKNSTIYLIHCQH